MFSELALSEQLWHLRNVTRYASSLIKSQRVGDSSIARIGITVHISEILPVGAYDLEARSGALFSSWPGSVTKPNKQEALCLGTRWTRP